MNRLTESLARCQRKNILREKWLIAPSVRVGYQWLDQVALSGQAAVNVRVKTLRNMAAELAEPALRERGLRPLTGRQGVFLTGIILSRLRAGKKGGYITSLEPGVRLLERLYSGLGELRLAGFDRRPVRPGSFEVRAKGSELAALMDEYRKELGARGLADYADCLRLAHEEAGRGTIAERFRDFLVLLPEDIELNLLEKALLRALPAESLEVLEVDGKPGGRMSDSSASEEQLEDSRLLAWLPDPQEAPAPKGDRTVRFFHAVGEINEVEEVFRRCLAEGYRLDQVELLHTDSSTYVPLIFEALQGLLPELAGQPPDWPVTFAEGVPVRYSRPGRALRAWLDWIEADYPQEHLARMIQEGLLEVPGAAGAPAPDPYALAGIMREPLVGLGRSRYLGKMDEWIETLEREPGGVSGAGDNAVEGGFSTGGRDDRERETLEGAKRLRDTVKALLEVSPGAGAGDRELAECALKFLSGFARCAGEIDNYGRKALVERLEELQEWLDEEGVGVEVGVSFNLRHYLAELPDQVPILGTGPRPGKIHVAGISGGGHSGRPVTFILGLDDGRFPGSRFEDPILLDSERKGLSENLKTSQMRIRQRLEGFHKLLARLRGHVILSFPSRNLQEERETSPGTVFLASWRIISGTRDADRRMMLQELPPAVSFAPESGDAACGAAGWWLWRLCVAKPRGDLMEIVNRSFPGLARGHKAELAREGDIFTHYDGLVPEAGRRHDSAKPEGPVLSSSSLETLGRCPLAFFFRNVLKIEPTEETTPDPSLWLDSAQAGSLLHDVFRTFLAELLRLDALPDDSSSRQRERLAAILDSRVRRFRHRYPPANESAFRRRYADLSSVAGTFLAEEARHCRKGRRPVWLEASIGMRSTLEPTSLDSGMPVFYPLPNGSGIRIRGRIDRVDRVHGPGRERYEIWDYKTGSSARYSFQDPFRKGRFLQHAVYLALAENRLRDVIGPESGVTRFGLFFPGLRDRGLRLYWSPEDLQEGRAIIASLCKLAASGAFLSTDNHKEDCTFCAFRQICGNNTEAVAAQSRRKLENMGNKVIEPFRNLRIKVKDK
ncbi:MAG: PD-(D/E)XK nuclease family protein [Gemmatimonadota bacterium]|nr:PD-(D/E)XK nuclease family protein [Gemmatimonadota bacterium]